LGEIIRITNRLVMMKISHDDNNKMIKNAADFDRRNWSK